jgi:hypothetical protein
MESVGGASHAHTRGGVEKVIRVALTAMLRELPAAQIDAAVALAVEGYVTEHLARGGTVNEE